MSAELVLDFWFNQLTSKQWFIKDAELDQEIKRKFSGLVEQAAACELFDWRHTARGRLAEIIVLDQFSRNIYRDTATAFAQDPLALCLAQEAVLANKDADLNPIERNFLYMPYMHSESAKVHLHAVTLFANNDVNDSYKFELKHKAIIDRFGRYPHRNKLLARASTPAEIEFLKQPGSGF
ncbi:DUF924 family protein [Gayadomonas joobiniege]|uniref:DUF924 family protein n=1 Tax=Gayadomonas joobiniege TaxID=1234606 RepID=UPI0003604C72|nr:DUF924 family protein [Gayadomonas joobiniege]